MLTYQTRRLDRPLTVRLTMRLTVRLTVKLTVRRDRRASAANGMLHDRRSAEKMFLAESQAISVKCKRSRNVRAAHNV